MNLDDEASEAAEGSGRVPHISIIIPTRNRAAPLRGQIAAVQGQIAAFDWELIIVDNGSTDQTAKAVRCIAATDPRIRLVLADEIPDAAYARNVGAACARADRIALIDDDDLVGSGWLEALCQALNRYPLIAPRIDYDLLNSRKVTDGWPLTQRAGLRTINGFAVSTGHIGVTTDIWNRLGGQRTGLLVGEDMDFAYRAAAELGIPPRYTPSAVYHRQLPTTLRGCYRQGRRDGRGRIQRVVLDEGRKWPTKSEAKSAARAVWWLVTRLPFAVMGKRRYLWAMCVGERVGRVRQAVAMRVMLL